MTLTADDPIFPQIAAAQQRWVKYYARHIHNGFDHIAARRIAYLKVKKELGFLPEAKRVRIIKCVENME